ncbi:PilZ domain-containing protein [uncultured Brachyspira sp.]|uniref:PilZ domain-containing protein n=1 Tax=uncultured Brachyspira sp. TaxID=221953 RepID=UPI00260D16A4|nr:PilZ domain-containing protein [uncultured Brachyspira sp.]
MDKEQIKAVIIENDPSILSKYKTAFSNLFSISSFADTNSSLAYIIENNLSIYFYIIRYNESEKDSIKFFTDKISKINPQIKLVLTNISEDFDTSLYPNALIFPKNTDVSAIVQSISNEISKFEENSKRRRQYSRVNWPLNVIIAYKDKIRGTIDRNILSISGNGAYISSDTNIPDKGDMLGLTISFKDFKLFTEAKVVWINNENQKPDLPKGFAVQFIDIGMASQKIIDQIIRDKLLQEILVEFKDENFSS